LTTGKGKGRNGNAEGLPASKDKDKEKRREPLMNADRTLMESDRSQSVFD